MKCFISGANNEVKTAVFKFEKTDGFAFMYPQNYWIELKTFGSDLQ